MKVMHWKIPGGHVAPDCVTAQVYTLEREMKNLFSLFAACCLALVVGCAKEEAASTEGEGSTATGAAADAMHAQHAGGGAGGAAHHAAGGTTEGGAAAGTTEGGAAAGTTEGGAAEGAATTEPAAN
jgi:hypothetical protein